MPRKALTITHELPYHITARSNNREWFYLPIQDCWDIFLLHLTTVAIRYHFQIHAFVLMNNHYHMIATTSEPYSLPKVMEWFQRSVNRTINDKSGRINHLFGGPYKASLIRDEQSYYHALRYVYRNPVTAKITKKVEDYSYSSLVDTRVPLTFPITGIASYIPKESCVLYEYLNKGYGKDEKELLDKAIKKTEFRLPSRIPKLLKGHLTF